MNCETCIHKNTGIGKGSMLCNVTIIDNVCPEYIFDDKLNYVNNIDLRKD